MPGGLGNHPPRPLQNSSRDALFKLRLYGMNTILVSQTTLPLKQNAGTRADEDSAITAAVDAVFDRHRASTGHHASIRAQGRWPKS